MRLLLLAILVFLPSKAAGQWALKLEQELGQEQDQHIVTVLIRLVWQGESLPNDKSKFPVSLQWEMSGLPAGAVKESRILNKEINCPVNRCLLIGYNNDPLQNGSVVAAISFPAQEISLQIGLTQAGYADGSQRPGFTPMAGSTLQIDPPKDRLPIRRRAFRHRDPKREPPVPSILQLRFL